MTSQYKTITITAITSDRGELILNNTQLLSTLEMANIWDYRCMADLSNAALRLAESSDH